MWTDDDFGYDQWYDLDPASHVNIQRQDGAVLYDVSPLKHGAHFTVHFCPKSKEIWGVDVEGLWSFIHRTKDWRISYSPKRHDDGQVSARGYLISCRHVREFGHPFAMPPDIADQLLKCRTKTEAGKLAEELFFELVDNGWFPRIFLAPARRSSQQSDMCDGIDAWVSNDVPIQIKYESFGGSLRPASGNLFFQTHTLPVRAAHNWHGYDYHASSRQKELF